MTCGRFVPASRPHLFIFCIRHFFVLNTSYVRGVFFIGLLIHTELEEELESRNKLPQASQTKTGKTAWDPSQFYNVRKNLEFLRKDAGFTSSRIGRAPLVRQLLGGANESYEMMRERLISAIQSLRDPHPEILLDVFGLDPQTEDMTYLKDRRRHYGDKHSIKIEAVADREDAAIDNLRKQLVTGWYPKSPTGFPVPQSHNGFVQQAVYIETVIRNRAWQENRE